MPRSSAYGSILGQIPDWVFGGEFGDISNLLNKRDSDAEKLRQQEIQTEANDIQLTSKKRGAKQDEMMIDQLSTLGENPTLRDLYELQRKAAIDAGSPDDLIKAQENLYKIQRQDQLDEITKQYKEALTESANRRGTGGKGSGGSKRLFQLENPDTGEKGVFLAEEANQKLQQGWDFYKKDDIGDLPGGRKNSSASSTGGSLIPWEDSPMVTPSPTPLAKGDTARQDPAPGDQVAVITRKRAKAVKGD